MSRPPARLGTPLELPWWVLPLGAPPLVTAVLAVLLAAPAWARVTAVVVSLATLATLVVIATRVASRNMQSVWVSALYAVWVFTVLVWAIAVATGAACRCA